MRYVTAAALALAVGLAASAQWGTRGCPPVGGFVRAQPVHVTPVMPGAVQVAAYAWRRHADDEWHLYAGVRQVGAYRPSTGTYLPLVGDGWGQACAPPIAPPARRPGDLPVVGQNFGVDVDKLKGGAAPRYWINGELVDKKKAYEAIENGIPDYATKYRLTVIGSDDARKKVVDDWAAADVGGLREQTLVWSVGPDHWSLKDNDSGKAMFVTAGNPTVYFQAPDGKVLYREDDYKGPGDFQAIRRAAENYDPKKDPGRQASPVAGIPPGVIGAAAALALLALILFARRKA